ncbi:MAG: dipeptide/oligopeptide/nickel ABC transporter ATP-binding protein [Alsobacter sp.]
MIEAPPLLESRGLSKSFPDKSGIFRQSRPFEAVRGAWLSVSAGQVVGIAGASGSGKSTLARLLVRLIEPDQGRLLHWGRDVLEMERRELLAWRRQAQLVPQNAYASLDPGKSAAQAIAAVARLHQPTKDARQVVEECLDKVGLSTNFAERLPRTLSGGQRQRLALARTLAVGAELLICDEPTSALDAIARSEIATLLQELNQRNGTTLIIVSHDEQLLGRLATRMLRMADGELSERS